MLFRALVLGLSTWLCLTHATIAQNPTRDQKVRADRAKVEADGFWIYNDLAKGFAEAERTGKPLLVVLRCIPCVECVKLDDDLVDKDPTIRPLLDKFVCVRQVSTNGLDLATFQYDTDQSFAVFMLNADKTIYGRFGTRSHHSEWLGDVSIKGLAAALSGALELHAAYPANKAALAAKTGPAPLFASPEMFPSLASNFTDSLNYEGDVVKSCIHCHQIGVAARAYYRSLGQPLPEELVFPYPHPKSIGLILDPNQRAAVKEVVAGSLAAAAGFKAGDQSRSLAGQPLLSMADVQWVLHGVGAGGGQVVADVVRGDHSLPITLSLPDGWRRLGDISWRVSSWGMRRMTLGGLSLIELTSEARRQAGLADGKMGLLVKGMGMYGASATAKKTGFLQGDIVVEFDGQDDLRSEGEVFLRAMTKRKVGDTVRVAVLRDGNRMEFALPMQE